MIEEAASQDRNQWRNLERPIFNKQKGDSHTLLWTFPDQVY